MQYLQHQILDSSMGLFSISYTEFNLEGERGQCVSGVEAT